MPDELTRETIKLENLRWFHRRRMAYISLLAILIVTYCVLFLIPEKRLIILNEIITWFYFCMSSIVGTYVGFSAVEYYKLHKK